MSKPLPEWLPRSILSLTRGYTANTFIADLIDEEGRRAVPGGATP